jgi:hypothetical protein
MSLTLNEPISVTMMYNHHQHKTVPLELIWRNRHYPITQIGLHHTYKEGDTLKHVFSVVSKDNFFEMSFDTNDLTWRLQKSDSATS